MYVVENNSLNKKMKWDLLDTHYKLGDTKARLRSNNMKNFNEKQIEAELYEKEWEENKEKIEK